MNREGFLATLAVVLLRAIGATLRLRLTGTTPEDLAASPTAVIFCFWHNRIVAIACTFLKFYPSSRKGVTVLTSPSRDGEVLAQVMAGLRMGSVRGSSSRRGARALRELARLVSSGTDAAITPDGPRGPRYSLGPGVLHLAQVTGAPILPVHAKFSRALRFKTWDGFTVPLPFSTVSVNVEKPLHIPREMSPEDFERTRLDLELAMQREAD